MTPEQAADNAAEVLTAARQYELDPERVAAMAVIADGWTRLHTALKTGQWVTVNMSDTTICEEPGQVEPEPEVWNPYRERAALIAFLATKQPAKIAYNDPASPDWAVIHFETPHGRLGWHLADDDLDLFLHVPFVEASEAPVWVDYTTAEKYERLAAVIRDHLDS